MHIQIASKGIDVSPALQDRIKSRLEEMMDKYIHREGEAQVFISREGTGFKTNCSIHLPSGATMEAQGQNHDGYAAADESLEHMEKRLRRYARRLKDHHAGAKKDAFSMFILENPIPENMDEDDATAHRAWAEALDRAGRHDHAAWCRAEAEAVSRSLTSERA